MDEKALFLAEMAGVSPLKQQDRVPTETPVSKKAVSVAQRRAAAEGGELVQRLGLSTADIDILDAFYPLDFKRPGIQNGVYKKLKQGKYQVEAVLDLHGHTVEKSRQALIAFIDEAHRLELRSVLVIHGRGQRAGSRGPVIKSYLNAWLPDLDEVQAFCSAQKRHGGLGAVYVMLRKVANQNIDK